MTVPVRSQMAPNSRWQFVLVYTAPKQAKAAAVDDVASAVAAGAIRVGAAAGLPLHHFPLEDAAGAHAAVESSIVGKVLIDVAPIEVVP
jgi:NADPH2:quinone reductase